MAKISVPGSIPLVKPRIPRMILMAAIWWPLSDLLQHNQLIKEAISVETNSH